MANFNRGRSGGGNFKRGGFGGRGSDRPVTMHQAICDTCRQNCEVPFRPTSGKPVFCKNCFAGNRSSDSMGSERRNFERPTNFDEKRMFEAVCDECGSSCKVPFAPRGDKPIYCSNCFGEKKGAGNKENGQCQSQCIAQFEALNQKLDRILKLLDPEIILKVDEVSDLKPEEPVVVIEEKVAKKRSPKKSK